MAAQLSVDTFRRRLDDERERLQGEIATMAAYLPEYDGSPNDSHYGNHVADEASDTFEEEKALALHAHLRGMLEEVEAALVRIHRGTFGRCEHCHQPIASERLEAISWARFCIDCQAQAERTR
ncbi:MAG: TraR/DksA C4-type zinc finger protein [Chloroflexi bacterium]|nr:TraR/DksA C4-type zinc finger protein [Chloroflexota bacterium]